MLKKGFYFTFLVSEKEELENMYRDLIFIVGHEKNECMQFIEKIKQCREKAKTLNSYLNQFGNSTCLVLETSISIRRDKILSKCVDLDTQIERIILQYFFKRGREVILKKTLLQENDWKYLICHNILRNYNGKLLESFITSLNEDEQIDIYLLIAMAYNNKVYRQYVNETTCNCVIPSYEEWFSWICNTNYEVAINLLSQNFDGVEKNFNGVTIGHKEYRNITTRFFESEYYYNNCSQEECFIIYGQSIIETQLLFLSMATEKKRISILNSLSSFEILNLLYSSELQKMQGEIKDTINTNLYEIFDNMDIAEKETAYLKYYKLSFESYVQLLKKVSLEERLDIMNVLKPDQISKIIDEIGIKEFRKLLF